ncbi:MAG: citramalate synthase [Nanoarchaeota archaeon]|nr:citramalate synthase [Nanoarchaeota archaeon]
MKLEIYDCTPREGEQAAEASFSLEDRISLFKLLDNFGADYVELGWPLASADISKSFKECMKLEKKSKIIAFGSTSIKENPDEDPNLNSIVESGAEYACIFGKTWLEHIANQLRITPEENLLRIKKSVTFLKDKEIKVFYDAEHFFDGFKDNKYYSLETLKAASDAGAERLVLCDTNGGSFPQEAETIVKQTREFLNLYKIKTGLGVHFHNDRGLALPNTLISLPYIVQVQGTMGGIGERVGNLDFSNFLPVYQKLGGELNVNLKKLKEVNEEVCRLSGLEMPENKSFVGNLAFAHKGGVHIDAVRKGGGRLYEHANPEDYGNKRIILLNTLGGSSGVISVAEQFGYRLDKKDPEMQRKITELFLELKELESRGYRVGAIPAEQFLLVEKYFGNLENLFEIEKWKVETGRTNGKEESEFYVKMKINGGSYEENLRIGGGPVDAAYKTISMLLSKRYPEMSKLQLTDFHVGIARRMKEESSVRTKISFQGNERFQIVGVDNNIIESALEALTKGFRYHINRTRRGD